jgi:hypothetical protein
MMRILIIMNRSASGTIVMDDVSMDVSIYAVQPRAKGARSASSVCRRNSSKPCGRCAPIAAAMMKISYPSFAKASSRRQMLHIGLI